MTANDEGIDVAKKHDDALRRVGTTQRTVVARIASRMDAATVEQIDAGMHWYADAQATAVQLAGLADVSVERAAVVIAHLSPMKTWAQNKRLASQFLVEGRRGGTFKAQVKAAIQALELDNPWVSFSATAHKTRSFAMNILGNDDAVTVDLWACRIAGIDQDKLSNVGLYEAVAHCHRLVARRYGVTPAQVQAITWCVERGSGE